MFKKFKYNLCVNTVHSVCSAKSVSSEIELLATVIISKAFCGRRNSYKRMLSNKFCIVETIWASMFVAIKMLNTKFNSLIYQKKFEQSLNELITSISFSLKKLFKLSASDFDSLYAQFKILNSDEKLYDSTPLEDYIDSLIDFITPYLLFSQQNKRIGYFEFEQDLIINFDPMSKLEYNLFFLSLAELINQFYPVNNGNFSETPIDAEEF